MSTFAQLNPFASTVPEHIEHTLDANAVCANFNKGGRYRGQFLAVGRLDGMVVVWDFTTRGPIQVLEGHVKPIVSLSWSRKSRFLLSASRDWNVILWDLKTGTRRNTLRFEAPVTSAALHPKNSKIVAVTLQGQAETILVDLRRGGGRSELIMPHFINEEASSSLRPAQKRETALLARFCPRRNLCFVGSSLGNIYVFALRNEEKKCIHTERVCSQPIKDLEFDPSGSSLVVNANDRCIRVYGLHYAQHPEEAPISYIVHHRFQDLISRNPWCHCTFSSDGEYVCAGTGSSENLANEIHIWDRSTGALVKILEGGKKDAIEGLDWHPSRPVIATVSDLGNIALWSLPSTERWAAYAPGFEELQENQEYIEAEDEFDVVDAAVLDKRKQDEQESFADILGDEDPLDMIVDDDGEETDPELRDDDDLDEDFVPVKGDNEVLGYDDFIEAGAPASKSTLINGSADLMAPGTNGDSVNAVLHVKKYEAPTETSTTPLHLNTGPPPTEEDLLQKAIAEIEAQERRPTRRRKA